MSSFNLSDWALKHRSFVYFLMVIATIAGVTSYNNLGREEDPPFTIKTMLVQASWPGATTQDMLLQVTERIEKELKQIDSLDYVKSFTSPGKTTVYVELRDTTKPGGIPQIWYQVRKHINDIKSQFPRDLQGPSFNDEFGDVYGNVYAFTGDGVSMRQLRDAVEFTRLATIDVPGLGKTTVIGDQAEAFYLDFSTRKLSQLGLDRQSIIQSLMAQNAVADTGVVQAGDERVFLRVSGEFTTKESLESINLRVNGRFFRLADIGKITQGYQDPPQTLFRYNGKPAIALAIAMQPGANILIFGKALSKKIDEAKAKLPVGFELDLVSNQPRIVEEAVDGFTKALLEAIAIVLAVSFISLGWRAGLVVSISIPLVLCCTFVVMEAMGIALQRISLGALIIALGLLVDDAMITVEMMVARLEVGEKIRDAATFAYTSTAFPMLTGTLVTVCGFIPIGFNGSSAGEYTYSLFVVIAAALLISWVVAVLFAPLLGVAILPKSMKKKHDDKPGFVARTFRSILLSAMRWRWMTIGASAALLAISIFGMRFVQQQFFPSSDRPALLVDFNLVQDSSINATLDQMNRFEKKLEGDGDIRLWSSYVGQSAVRFYLSLDPQPANPFFGQILVETKDLDARKRVEQKLQKIAKEEFVGTDVYVHTLELGPPVGRPIQYRLRGPDIEVVREKALELANVVGSEPHLDVPTFDWNEPAKVLRVDILQDKARELGISSQDIASFFNSMVAGRSITQIRDSIYLVPLIGRAEAQERNSLDIYSGLQIPTSGGKVVPLLAFATLRYDLEQPLVWRRDRLPTITVRASIIGNEEATSVVKLLQPKIDKFAASLPATYEVQLGGEVEESNKGLGPIISVAPIMLLAMAFVLMVQLQSFQKMIIVASVAPLGLIGVVAAMLLSDRPLGFVAILGVLALIGIIIRNSVILVHSIEENERDGHRPWDAVLEATCHRMRPIMLTAAAACLGMIPIALEVFWGPMAFAMIGGILAATVLTLLFLPALYIAWFRIKEGEASKAEDAPPADIQVAAQ